MSDNFGDDVTIQKILHESQKNDSDLRLNLSRSAATQLVLSIVSKPVCTNFDLAKTKLKDRLINWNKTSFFAHPRWGNREWHIWSVAPKGSFCFYYTMQTCIFNCERRLLGDGHAAEVLPTIIDIEDFLPLLFGTVEEIPLPDPIERYVNKHKDRAVLESNAVKTALRHNNERIDILEDMVSLLKIQQDNLENKILNYLIQHLQTYFDNLKTERENVKKKTTESDVQNALNIAFHKRHSIHQTINSLLQQLYLLTS